MTAPSRSPVAIIDIGSNSIKSLVARRGEDVAVELVHGLTIEARISAGISGVRPRLGEEGMQRGVDAIRELLADAAPFHPRSTRLVATSAVRDAANGLEFRERVRAATGCEIRILTGEEEANAIGRGLTCDPALRHLRDFYLFDLGGGSLECLSFRDRRVDRAVSLQLGCVRLTERFVADPAAPFSPEAAAAIAAHAGEELARSGFLFDLPTGAAAVATGGTVATLRTILGERAGTDFEHTTPRVGLDAVRGLLAELGALPLAERRHVAGLPAGRADVFPAALATLQRLADAGGFTEFINSVYNLRYGLADEALAEVSSGDATNA